MKLALAFLLCAAPLSAQQWDHDWNLTARDSREHFAAGVGLGVATKLVLPESRTWQRLAVVATIALAYEFGQESIARSTGASGPGLGLGPKDWLLGVLGASLVELVWRGGRTR